MHLSLISYFLLEEVDFLEEAELFLLEEELLVLEQQQEELQVLP